jgi:hypothetical protein
MTSNIDIAFDINDNLFQLIKNKFPLKFNQSCGCTCKNIGLELSVNLFLLVNKIRNGCFIEFDNIEIEEILKSFQNIYNDLYYYQIKNGVGCAQRGFVIVNSSYDSNIVSNETLEAYIKTSYETDNNYDLVIGKICDYQFIYNFHGDYCSQDDSKDARLSLGYQIFEKSDRKLLNTSYLYSFTIKYNDVGLLNLQPIIYLENKLEKLLEKMFPDNHVSTNIEIQVNKKHAVSNENQMNNFLDNVIVQSFMLGTTIGFYGIVFYKILMMLLK